MVIIVVYFRAKKDFRADRMPFVKLLIFVVGVYWVICGTDVFASDDAISIGDNKIDIRKVDDVYHIGEHDLLSLQVFQTEDFNMDVRVDTEGYISLPLIGNVEAAGLSVVELEAKLETELGREYFQDPDVTVYIKEFTSQRVTIEGNVKSPGIYPLKGRTTLLQVIAMAEGLDDIADRTNIQVYSKNGGDKRQDVYDIDQIRGGERVDPRIFEDDVIVVNRSGSKSFVKNVTDTLRGFISFGTVTLD